MIRPIKFNHMISGGTLRKNNKTGWYGKEVVMKPRHKAQLPLILLCVAFGLGGEGADTEGKPMLASIALFCAP